MRSLNDISISDVNESVSLLAHDPCRSRLTQAVRNTLGKPDRPSKPLGQLDCREMMVVVTRKRQQAPEIDSSSECGRFADLAQPAIGHGVAWSTSARDPHFVDRHARGLRYPG